MGEILDVFDYIDHKAQINELVITTLGTESNSRVFKEYESIYLNLVLSQILMKLPADSRVSSLESELNNFLRSLDKKNIIIKGVDILFNPSYKLNIINYFMKLNRTKNVVLVWPGLLENEKLSYSEIVLPDYSVYEINKYDIVCIK